MDEAMEIFFKFSGEADDAGMDAFNDVEEMPVDGTAALAVEHGEDMSTEAPQESDTDSNENGLYLIDNGEPFNGAEAQVGVLYDPVTGAEKAVTESMYSVKYAAKQLGISHQTVRNYAYEISEYLAGGRSAEGNLLFTEEDINLIGDVYKYCKAKGIKKSLAKAYYFNEAQAGTSSEKASAPSSKVSDIKDKFLESMYDKMDKLTDVMVLLSEHIDSNARIIASFDEKIEVQNGVIGEIRENLESEKAEREKLAGLIRSNSDSVKSFIGDKTNKAKDEIISAIKEMNGTPSDMSEMEKSLEETRAAVKGLSKVVNRIETKLSQTNALTGENFADILKDAGITSDNKDSELLKENEELKKKVQELTEQNVILGSGFVKEPVQSEEMEALIDKNEELAERAVKAEETVKEMALRISELESGDGSQGDLKIANETLRKKLEQTQTAFKNISAYVKKLENEGKTADVPAPSDELLNENKRLSDELSQAKTVMERMAKRIAYLENGASDEVQFEELISQNAYLTNELANTKRAFANISKRLKEVEAGASATPDSMVDDLYRLTEENKELKKALLEQKAAGVKETKKPVKEKAKPVKEKKSLFSKKEKPSVAAAILPVESVPTEEQLRIERAARKLDITSEMPDIDEDYGTQNDTAEWHDEIEELPDGLFGIDDVDVDEQLSAIDVDAAIDKGAAVEAKEEKKKADKEKKKKKFFGLF